MLYRTGINAVPVLVLLTDSELHFFTKLISWIFWVFQARTPLLFPPLIRYILPHLDKKRL
jgi:hypothetical protein